MLYLVAYDIADSTRLRKTATICEDYGFRIEYSVFECRLSAERLEKLKRELEAIIAPKEDAIIIYPVCSECEKKAQRLGVAKKVPQNDLFII